MENYTSVISASEWQSGELLAPASSERKTHGDEAETNHHIPGPDMGDWV